MLPSNAVLFLGFLIYGCVNCVSSASCPDSYLISPCICTVDSNGLATTVCNDLGRWEDVQNVFSNVPGWKIDSFQLTNSVMLFIPSSILDRSKIDEFIVQNSTFSSLFDEPPVTDITNLKIINTKFLRGFDWRMFSRMRLQVLHIENTQVKFLGKQFRDGVPQTLNSLALIGTKLRKIENDSLVKLDQLYVLVIRNNSLRSIDNLIFPSKVVIVDFSHNFIESLRDGIFNILPHDDRLFILENNLITTLKKEVFLDVNDFTDVFLGIGEEGDNPINCDCDVKWITTSGIDKKKISGACAAPESVKDKLIEELTASDFDYCP